MKPKHMLNHSCPLSLHMLIYTHVNFVTLFVYMAKGSAKWSKWSLFLSTGYYQMEFSEAHEFESHKQF